MSISTTQHSLGTILELAEMAGLRKFTREEFYAMDRAGIFDKDFRVELIDGRIITELAPIGGAHAWNVQKLTRALVHCTDNTEYDVRVQSSVSLPGERELQPDLVVYKPKPENATQNPGPDQIALVIEVADTSLRYDRVSKMELYASSNIPVYWVVDVSHKRVFIYTEPQNGTYAYLEPRSGDDKLTVCGCDFPVADIF